MIHAKRAKTGEASRLLVAAGSMCIVLGVWWHVTFTAMAAEMTHAIHDDQPLRRSSSRTISGIPRLVLTVEEGADTGVGFHTRRRPSTATAKQKSQPTQTERRKK